MVAVYVGGEARRLGSVRVSVATGPAIVTLKRVTIEAEAGDETIVDRLTTFRQVKGGRGAKVMADEMAIVKGRTLRLAVPLDANGCGCSPSNVRG